MADIGVHEAVGAAVGVATEPPDIATCEAHRLHPQAVDRARAAEPDAETLIRMAELFGALADPTRLQILLALAASELCVCDLAVVVDLSQSAVSHQLRVLRQLRMVRSRRSGKLVYYRLDDDHVLSLCQQTRAHLSEAHPPPGSGA